MQDYVIIIPVRAATPMIAASVAGTVSDNVPFDTGYGDDVMQMRHPLILPRAVTEAEYSQDEEFGDTVGEYIREGYNPNPMPDGMPEV